MKHITIHDLDTAREEIIVQYDTIIPEFHMKHVLDLASIVGTHHVPREAYIEEYSIEYMPAYS